MEPQPDVAYATHQLGQLAQHAQRPLSKALSLEVRQYAWDPTVGSSPLFVHAADVYDALLAGQTALDRRAQDVLATPLAQLVALDCKAVDELRKQLGKAVAREEAARERMVAARGKASAKGQKAEAEYEEAHKARLVMEASYDARSKALLLAWKHDTAVAVLSHLLVLREHHLKMAALLDKEASWLTETMRREEAVRKREFDLLAKRTSSSAAAAAASAASAASATADAPVPPLEHPRPTKPLPTVPDAGAALPPPPPPPPSQSQGLLSLWSNKGSMWVPRWVVVDDCRVSVFKSWRDGWPHKTRIITSWSKLALSGNVLTLQTDDDLDASVPVSTRFQAGSALEAQAWFRLIESLISTAHTRDSATLSRRSVMLPAAAGASDTLLLAPDASSNQFPASLDAAETMLQGCSCSECGAADGASTVWCCVQLGVIMCSACADAFQRSGFRSVVPLKDLDTVSMQLLLCTGNALAQLLWEQRKAAADEARPDLTSDVDARVAWIHAKYAHRRFVAPQEGAPSLSAVLHKPAADASTQALAVAMLAEIAQGTWMPDAAFDGVPLLHKLVGALQPPRKVDVLLLLAILNGCALDGPAPRTGDRALHVALRGDRVEAARLLLLQGADETLANAAGEVPRALAWGRCLALFAAADRLSDAPAAAAAATTVAGASTTSGKKLPPLALSINRVPSLASVSTANATAATTTTSGAPPVADDEAALDSFLSGASSSMLPELSDGGLTLASYENADLSVLSPRSARKKDILADSKKQPSHSAERLDDSAALLASKGSGSGWSKKADSGPLERDAQQRALVEVAKKDKAKKKRNAAFVKLRDNIKFAVLPGSAASALDEPEGRPAEVATTTITTTATAATAATTSNGSEGQQTLRQRSAVDLSAATLSRDTPPSPRKKSTTPQSSTSSTPSPLSPRKQRQGVRSAAGTGSERVSPRAESVSFGAVTLPLMTPVADRPAAPTALPELPAVVHSLKALTVPLSHPPVGVDHFERRAFSAVVKQRPSREHVASEPLAATAAVERRAPVGRGAGPLAEPPQQQQQQPAVRSFDERLATLVKLRSDGIVSEVEFQSRLLQLVSRPASTIKEDGKEKRLAVLRELYARGIISKEELESRFWKVINPSKG